ncbi:hypothetical protein [Paenibacillus lautus]|uniref:hypothetical protein n=1 Tax=Paenibacillus lautus TaxID=1401 RepID=UPI003987C1F4
MQIGRKIYYDNRTGEVLADTGQRSGSVRETTREEDFSTYLRLAERTPESVGMIQLEYDQFKQDFDEGVLERVDPDKRELFFNYPGPDDPEAPLEPRKPLSVEVDELKAADIENKQAIAELTMMIAVPVA